MIKLPHGFVMMLLSLFRFKSAQKNFGATPHTSITTELKDKQSK